MKSPEVNFYIITKIEGQEKHIKVVQLETTDGVPYYACYLGETELTQLRNEVYGKWEQLWGNLDKQVIADIGSKIEEKIPSA